jgi:hypothetical protein
MSHIMYDTYISYHLSYYVRIVSSISEVMDVYTYICICNVISTCTYVSTSFRPAMSENAKPAMKPQIGNL